jgi:hypothetical protein
VSEKPFIERTFEFFTSMPGQILMAGLVGGILRWLTTEKTWKGGVASLLAGLASAWYIAPPLAAYLAADLPVGPKNVELVAVCAFFAGVGGISLVALIVNISRGINTNAVVKSLISFAGEILRLKFGGGPRP